MKNVDRETQMNKTDREEIQINKNELTINRSRNEKAMMECQ